VSHEDPALPGAVDVMTYVVDVLNDIGLPADLRVLKLDPYAEGIYADEPQMYLFGWGSDYLGAGDFIQTQFRCGAGANASNLCSRSLDRRMERAKELQRTDPGAAIAAWTEIEHDLVEAGVWAAVTNPVATDVFSARVGNAQIHPQWGVLLSRLWVR
jgi:ABC-type transport system substrate-binding protein